MKCDHCGKDELAPANLTLREDGKHAGERWCPTCLYAEESAAWTKQTLFVGPESPVPRTDYIPPSGTSDTAAPGPASRSRRRRSGSS